MELEAYNLFWYTVQYTHIRLPPSCSYIYWEDALSPPLLWLNGGIMELSAGGRHLPSYSPNTPPVPPPSCFLPLFFPNPSFLPPSPSFSFRSSFPLASSSFVPPSLLPHFFLLPASFSLPLRLSVLLLFICRKNHCILILLLLSTSIADPWHFVTDPDADPDPRFRTSQVRKQ